MGKNWYFYLLIIINLLLISKIPAWAQEDDPKTIKFKSFTPIPTRTPTVTVTRAPTVKPPAVTLQITQPIIEQATLSPTPGDGGGGGGGNNGGNPEDCAAIGLSMFVPQPRFLQETTLCDQGVIWPPYPKSFIPSNMVNLDKALKGKYWVRRSEIVYKSGLTEQLADLLNFISKSCEPFVGYAYRSYTEQEGLYYGKNCPTNPGCGVAPPGKSVHQAGIAVDLFCVRLDSGGVAQIYTVPQAAIANARNFGFDHPLSWDTPHFNGL